MLLLDMNLMALGVAIVACSITGAIWYAEGVFGRPWLRAQGKTVEDLGSPAPPLVVQLLATSCICAVIGGIDLLDRNGEMPAGMYIAFCLGLLLQTWAARLWLGFNATVCLIDTGYVATILALASASFHYLG